MERSFNKHLASTSPIDRPAASFCQSRARSKKLCKVDSGAQTQSGRPGNETQQRNIIQFIITSVACAHVEAKHCTCNALMMLALQNPEFLLSATCAYFVHVSSELHALQDISFQQHQFSSIVNERENGGRSCSEWQRRRFSLNKPDSYHTSFWILRSWDKDLKRDRTLSSGHPSAAITMLTAVCATSCTRAHICLHVMP